MIPNGVRVEHEEEFQGGAVGRGATQAVEEGFQSSSEQLWIGTVRSEEFPNVDLAVIFSRKVRESVGRWFYR